MKTRYSTPELCIVLLDGQDVILASGTDEPKDTGLGINRKEVGTLPEIPFDSPEA